MWDLVKGERGNRTGFRSASLEPQLVPTHFGDLRSQIPHDFALCCNDRLK